MNQRSTARLRAHSAAWRRAARRMVGVVTAAVAVATVLVPAAVADDPAAAWESSSSRCSAPYPTSATFYVLAGASVPAAYQQPLRNAAAAWDAWSGVTGIAVKVAASADAIPSNGLRIDLSAKELLTKPRARASATARCVGGPISGGSITLSTTVLGHRDDKGKQITLAHELGHVFGLGDLGAPGNVECSSIMYSPSPDGWNCPDFTGPRMDDIAGVVSLWRPQATPGFPAGSRIATVYLDRYLLSSSAYWAGWLNNLSFSAPDPDGYSDWTYVKDKANDGWGWIVNPGSSLCLVEHQKRVHMDYCGSDAGRWAVSQRSGKTLLLNKSSRECLGGDSQESVGARMVSCASTDAQLTVQPSGAARGKRSLPDGLGDEIIGAQSNKCITATGGGLAPGTGLSIRGCTGTQDQRWVAQPMNGGHALVVYQGGLPGQDPEEDSPELCVQGSGGSVSLQPCAVVAAETWVLNADGTIRNLATGTCLNVSGGATGDGSPLILWGCATTDNMVWSIPDALRTSVFSLAPLSSSTGGVLGTAPAPAGAANQRVQAVLTKKALADQARWAFFDVNGSNGGGLLKNQATGTCLRWSGRSGQAVLDDACNGSDSSYRWAPTVRAGGTMVIQSQYTGECLDVSGGVDSEGRPVLTYPCGQNNPNQLWRPVPNVPLAPTVGNAPTVGPNLAMFGAATQSSTSGDNPAGLAIDGNPDGNFYGRSTTHTESQQYAWWQVDLGESYPIDTVTIYNRTDCCVERSKDLWVFFSANPFPDGKTPDQLRSVSGVTAYRLTDNTAPKATVSLSSGSYRYVRVQLPGTDVLSLSEVSITERR